MKIVVVVVDNEGEPNNQALVEDFSLRCHFPVHYIHEPRRGIPQARNAALEKCRSLRADWLAFTDDDCWVSPTWLDSLLEAAARHNADVVYGRREFLFPMPLPFWAMRAEQGTHAEGDVLTYAATHNVLMAAWLVCGKPRMRFDERLPHGEDTDFFHRAARRGARIVYSAAPLVLEVVSPDRATFHYHTKRAYYYAASRSYFHRRYTGAHRAAMRLAVRCTFHAPMAVARLIAASLPGRSVRIPSGALSSRYRAPGRYGRRHGRLAWLQGQSLSEHRWILSEGLARRNSILCRAYHILDVGDMLCPRACNGYPHQHQDDAGNCDDEGQQWGLRCGHLCRKREPPR